MKIIGNFLFCNQLYRDTEKSCPLVIDIASITFIRVMNAEIQGEIREVVEVNLQTEQDIFVDYDPNRFFEDFAELIEDEKTCCH